MSLMHAFSVGHLGISGIEWPGIGFYKFSPVDPSYASTPGETNTQAGKLSTLTRSGVSHGWHYMPLLVCKASATKVCFGARFTGLNKILGDTNTSPFYVNLAGTKYYPFQSVNNIPAGETYLEVEIDRTTNLITGYMDGVLAYGPVGIATYAPPTMSDAGFTIGLCVRNYNSSIGGTNVLVSDFYVTQTDGIYPEGRLGPVKIKSVPVRVSSVSGFDKTAAELEAIVNTKVVNTSGQPITKGQVAKAIAASAEVNFSLDLTGIDVSRQIGAGIFVGAQRVGTVPVNATIERTLDGVTKSDQALDLATRNADRLNYVIPIPARTAQAARSINDITHKLKLVEA